MNESTRRVLGEARKRWAPGSSGTAKRQSEVAAIVIGEIERDLDNERSWTNDEIQAALNKADSLACELDWNMGDSGALEDFLNVHANALLCILEDPGREWTLDDVLNAGWADSDYDEDYADAAGWVRNWH